VRKLLALVLALCVPGPASAQAPEAAQDGRVRIHVEEPATGGVVESRTHQARIEGNASAAGERPRDYDVMLAIDVSRSTLVASGVDVDGDGDLGVNPHMELIAPGTYGDDVYSTDPGDTILAAEIQAARTLIGSLDARRVRVGVLTFAGEVDRTTNMRRSPDQKDAWLEIPLTHDFDRVPQTLNGILARGPRGATNFAAGIRLAITELSGLSGAVSQPRDAAEKVILFLTDGTPTFPIGKSDVSDPGDLEAAVAAARLAHEAGIKINTYALGPGALTYPLAATEVARVTLGTFTPIQNPGDIVAVLQAISFANVEDVVLTNLTTGELSTDVQLSPDGSFAGFVPVAEGRNRVRVSALASNGDRGSIELDLDFRVAGLSDQEKQMELERIRRLNKELLLLKEKKRIEDFRRDQEKELELRGAEGSKAEEPKP
jgi:hypothetical protein